MTAMTRLPAWLLLLLVGVAFSHAWFNRKKVCTQRKEVGPCRASIPMWWYDAYRGYCTLFTYGGCGGNENKFQHCHECMKKCGGMGWRKAKKFCRKLEKPIGTNTGPYKPNYARRPK
uniref:Putative tick kunitz 24 n=1 Tax=Amblyomma americanum TaxID=6943 RepID=A0A0C9SEU2_AMBAM